MPHIVIGLAARRDSAPGHAPARDGHHIAVAVAYCEILSDEEWCDAVYQASGHGSQESYGQVQAVDHVALALRQRLPRALLIGDDVTVDGRVYTLERTGWTAVRGEPTPVGTEQPAPV